MNQQIIDLSRYENQFTLKNKLGRLIWSFCYFILFRPFSLNLFHNWRNFILRLFGAKIGQGSIVHASVRVWAPWNLNVGNYTCIGQDVDCYNQGFITIGDNTTISQKSYLCASSHNYTSPGNELVLKPIVIADQVWVAAEAFIGPGVKIGQGAVVGARSAVFKNVDTWTVVGGNPAQMIKNRVIYGE
jgi:Acetyltransferase (isoleucine patch superfamily)